MRSRPQRAASLPPAGLDGLDPVWSRLVAAAGATWHILDNAAALEQRGISPVGTILCVHGNPTWSYLWRRLVADATESGWRVVAVDQLEMGFSERTGLDRTLETRVRDLGELTDALGLEGRVVTLGHDWGGVVSLGWAVDHPGLLAGVMLLNTAIHQPEDYAIPAPLRLALAPGIREFSTVTTPAFLETTLALAHPRLSPRVRSAYRAPYKGASTRAGIGGFVADIPLDGHASRPELDRIAEAVRALIVPVLMLWGPSDPIFSDRYLNDLIERMPKADVHRFEGAGHLIAEDVDYAAAALTWLADQQVVSQSLPPAFRPPNSLTRGRAPLSGALGGTLPRVRDAQVVHEAGATTDAADSRPLWGHLDELRDSDETALVEMAPARGSGSRTGKRTVSWRLLSRRVQQLAAGLSAIGVREGDRVSLVIPPGADLTAVLYACLRIGAVVVVADAGLGLGGLTRAVRGAWPAYVIGAAPGLIAARGLNWPGLKISTARLMPAAAASLGVKYALADLIELGARTAMPGGPTPADVAAVLFTSGSTGPAKGVVYTHGQLAAIRDALAARYAVGVGTGLVAGFAPFALLGPALGARSVTPEMDVTSPRTLTAVAVAAAVDAVDASVVFLSPAALANVVETSGNLTPAHRRALERVTTFLSAGAPVSAGLLAAASELMPSATAHTPYGMTEGLLMTDVTLDELRAAENSAAGTSGQVSSGSTGICVGTPIATTLVRISPLDQTGAAVGELTDSANLTGEIVVSAPHLKDYYDRLWLTERDSRSTSATQQRWHRTGDVGHLDAAGRLWVEGRMPHIVTTPFGVVTPVGLEQAIERLGDVRRAAIVGVGPAGTQQLVAIVETGDPARRVQLAHPALAAAVRSAVSLPIAAILVVPRLPTDIRHNSKIDRAKLARWAGVILTGGRMRQP